VINWKNTESLYRVKIDNHRGERELTERVDISNLLNESSWEKTTLKRRKGATEEKKGARKIR